MRIFFLFALLASPLFSWSQVNLVASGSTQCTWQEINLVDSSFQSSDSSVIFATTRSVLQNKGREFLGTEIASDSLLRFYTIYFNGNSWKAAPRNSLADALKSNRSSSDFVVYTEGDGKTFPDNIDRSTRLSRLYHVNVIMFDWPSRVPGYGGIKNVRNTVRNTQAVAKQFHTLLLNLQDYKMAFPEKMTHLSLFFHSLGNAVFKNSVERYGTADLQKDLADNIILNAACVPLRKHRSWLEKLCFQEHIYVMYNRKDKTLREASILFGKRLLGCQLNKRLAPNTRYINLAPLALNKHNYFLIIPLLNQHPGIPSFFTSVFHANTLDLSDTSRLRRRSNGKGFTLL
jgi:hypothetical protein